MLGALIGGGLSLAGALLGNKADKAKNKLAKQEFAYQKQLGDQQIKISDYIQALSKQLMGQGSGLVDPYGGSATYDPATGRWVTTMGATPGNLQRASDEEELQRFTVDQAIRRRGIQDKDAMRRAGVSEADIALGDMGRFKQGIGKIDPVELASRIRLDRTNAVNAGYDDAERAATKLQLRTGSSAVGAGLNDLARGRVRAQAEIGSPEVEALQLAEGINMGRSQNLTSLYDMFNTKGGDVFDASFASAPYAELAAARGQDAQKLDLSRYEVGMGGSGTAAAGIGSAAAGIRAAYTDAEKNKVHAPNAKLLGGLANLFSSFGK